MIQHHKLKTWPRYYDAVERGEKLFECRLNDRFFQRGDTVELIRMNADNYGCGYATPKQSMTFTIGPILHGPNFGIQAGYCVFSLLRLAEQKDASR